MVMYGLLLLMGALPVLNGLKVLDFCSGKKFSLPANIMSRVPLMSYIYFTPIAPGANMSVVMNMTQSLDPHYQYKDETIFITELSDRDQGTFSWSHHDSTQLTDFLKLVMKDCSEQMDVYYGEKLAISLQKRAAVLEFSPILEPLDTQVVWRREQAHSAVWSVDAATSNHEGNYTARTHSGLELKKIRVRVIAKPKTFKVIVQEERNLDVPLPIPVSEVSITFRDSSDTERKLYQRGRGILQAINLFKGRFSLQNQPSGSSLQIHSLKPYDAGTYEVRDSKGLLVVSAVVESRDITDCSDQLDVYYGNKLEILLPSLATVLEFHPSFEPSATQVVWRREQASQWWSVDSATSDHDGSYSARTNRGLELKRTCVRVKANSHTFQTSVEEKSVVVPIPIPASKVSIIFRNQFDEEYVLYQRGMETSDTFYFFEGRFSLQNQPSGSSLQLYDLRPSDAGTYEVWDSNILVLNVVVTSELPDDPQPLTFIYVAVIVIVFVLLCWWCVCKCCCKKSRSSSVSNSHNQSPGPYAIPKAQNWYHQPKARSALTDGFTHKPTTLDAEMEGSLMYRLPPNLSPQSDAEPCFQPTRRNGDSLDFLFTSPLTTDRLPDTVYTSDKLNFL